MTDGREYEIDPTLKQTRYYDKINPDQGTPSSGSAAIKSSFITFGYKVDSHPAFKGLDDTDLDLPAL